MSRSGKRWMGLYGGHLNLDLVRKIETLVKGNDHFVRITWQNGNTEEFHKGEDENTYNALTSMGYDEWALHVVPADSGYELLTWLPPEADQPELLMRSPVIAWEICDENARGNWCVDNVAIGINGLSSAKWSVVICPQGYIIMHDYCIRWSNEAEWLEWIKQEWANSQKEAAE
jgi:hypothetical protein